MTLPEPVKVSPLIKLFRYGLLIAGIFYGASKYKHFQKREAGKKEERQRRQEERDLQVAEERRIASERDIANLVAIFSPESDPKTKPPEEKESQEMCTFKEVTKKPDEDTCIFKEVENKPPPKEGESHVSDGECDIFSEKFNLSDKMPKHSTTESKSNDVPKISEIPINNVPKNNDVPIIIDASKQNGDCKGPSAPSDENEYFVETFQKGIPYASPENKESDFLPK